jgi:hypothetical protein
MKEKNKKPKTFKNYDYEKAFPFFDKIFHDTNYDGYIYFCIKKGKTFNTIHCCKASERKKFMKKLSVTGNINYYFTPEHFRVGKDGVKRDSRHLFAFICAVVDIDCHESGVSKETLRKNINRYLAKLDMMIELENYIPYNIVVYTKRGIQLYYIYERAISYKVSFIHERVCGIILEQHRKIIDDFQELGLSLDAATTKRASGLFRLPCTFNSHSKDSTLIEYEISAYNYLDTDKIFDSLAPAENKPTAVYEIAEQFRDTGKANIARCKKVINAINMYQADMIASANTHKNRTCTCFVLSSFLLAVMPYEKALAVLNEFNSRYPIPLSQHRIKTIMDYSLKNYTDKDKCGMRYFKNKTILEYLNLTSGDYGIVYTEDFSYNPCYTGISKEERERRKKAKKKRNKAIIDAIKNGTSYKEIAKDMNVSVATVYRIADRNSLEPPQKEKPAAPWEELGISRATYYRNKKKE